MLQVELSADVMYSWPFLDRSAGGLAMYVAVDISAVESYLLHVINGIAPASLHRSWA